MESKSTPTESTIQSSVVPLIKPTDSNTVVSSAVSSVETKDSIMTSIPSEAPVRDVVSVDSNSILPLIEETFENSVTGNLGGDAAKNQPFRKHARCSAQTHFDAACSECESIENNLKKDSKRNAIEMQPSNEKSHLSAVQSSNLSTSNENVWQISHADKYGSTEKFSVHPITVCSAQDKSSLANISPLKFGVDSTSFIILRDENENASHFLPNITSNDSNPSINRNVGFPPKVQNRFDRPCDDCCFCNPSLHHKRRHNGNEHSPKRCNFCSSRQQSTQTTPATSIRQQEYTQSLNNDAEATSRSSAPIERIYESKYRSNHTHIRTHSKESDTVNTQCTKKTNKKVRKTLLNGNEDHSNANYINSNANTANDGKSDKLNGNEENGKKSEAKYKSSIPKLPAATNQEWIVNSMDSATSPASTNSNSTGSSTKSRRKYDSKSVPNLPKADRGWPTVAADSSPNAKSQKTRQNSRYQNFYGNGTNGANDERTTVTSGECTTKSKPTGNIQREMISHIVNLCLCVRVCLFVSHCVCILTIFTAFLFITFHGISSDM